MTAAARNGRILSPWLPCEQQNDVRAEVVCELNMYDGFLSLLT